MTVSDDDIPRKPQQTRARFRYRPRSHLKPDAAPADIAFMRIMQRTHYLRDRAPGQARIAWRDLIDYCTLPLKNPSLLDVAEYCHAHIDCISNPNAQDLIANMMDAAHREKSISDKQADYLLDLYEKLLRKRR